jgi:chromosome segregation ATPase
MASEKSPFLVDAVKASASRFRETKNALDARQKELDARQAELEAQRADMERHAARLNAEREEFQREKDQVNASRSAIDRDLGTIRMEREKYGGEEKRIQDWARALGEREKAVKEGEDRQTHIDVELSGHLKESEAKINSLLERDELAAQRERALADTIEKLVMMERGLAERDKKLARREEELVKLQGDRLNALEAREREMLKISEDMHSRQKESAAQHESFVELQDTLRQELLRIAGERERLAEKERSLVEAEKYLAAALEASGIDMTPIEEAEGLPGRCLGADDPRPRDRQEGPRPGTERERDP